MCCPWWRIWCPCGDCDAPLGERDALLDNVMPLIENMMPLQQTQLALSDTGADNLHWRFFHLSFMSSRSSAAQVITYIIAERSAQLRSPTCRILFPRGRSTRSNQNDTNKDNSCIPTSQSTLHLSLCEADYFPPFVQMCSSKFSSHSTHLLNRLVTPQPFPYKIFVFFLLSD